MSFDCNAFSALYEKSYVLVFWNWIWLQFVNLFRSVNIWNRDGIYIRSVELESPPKP